MFRIMTDKSGCLRAVHSGVALIALLCVISPASAALLYYDGFEYPSTPSPQQLIGKTNVEYSKIWSQPALPNNNRQTIMGGNLTYEGFPDPAPGSNSVLNPRGSVTQNGLARVDIPGAPYTSGSLYFSMLLKATTWANLNYALSTNEANKGGGWLGGFHYGQGTENATTVPPFAYQLKTLRFADPSLDPLANQPQRYHLGVVKSAASGVNGPRSWDLTGTDERRCYGRSDVSGGRRAKRVRRRCRRAGTLRLARHFLSSQIARAATETASENSASADPIGSRSTSTSSSSSSAAGPAAMRPVASKTWTYSVE